MVTYFNKKDLVAFGNFLLSDKRREFLEQHTEHPQEIEHRLKTVDHADVENFLETIKKVD